MLFKEYRTWSLISNHGWKDWILLVECRVLVKKMEELEDRWNHKLLLKGLKLDRLGRELTQSDLQILGSSLLPHHLTALYLLCLTSIFCLFSRWSLTSWMGLYHFVWILQCFLLPMSIIQSLLNPPSPTWPDSWPISNLTAHESVSIPISPCCRSLRLFPRLCHGLLSVPQKDPLLSAFLVPWLVPSNLSCLNFSACLAGFP